MLPRGKLHWLKQIILDLLLHFDFRDWSDGVFYRGNDLLRRHFKGISFDIVNLDYLIIVRILLVLKRHAFLLLLLIRRLMGQFKLLLLVNDWLGFRWFISYWILSGTTNTLRKNGIIFGTNLSCFQSIRLKLFSSFCFLLDWLVFLEPKAGELLRLSAFFWLFRIDCFCFSWLLHFRRLHQVSARFCTMLWQDLRLAWLFFIKPSLHGADWTLRHWDLLWLLFLSVNADFWLKAIRFFLFVHIYCKNLLELIQF